VLVLDLSILDPLALIHSITMDSLPEEILEYIFQYVPFYERNTSINLVCRRFNKICQRSLLWKHFTCKITINENVLAVLCRHAAHLHVLHMNDVLFTHATSIAGLAECTTILQPLLQQCYNLRVLNLSNNPCVTTVSSLMYMVHLKELNIESCYNIDADDFLHQIVSCHKLAVLKMAHCSQFQEQHIVQIIMSLTNIEHFDAERCCRLSYDTVADILIDRKLTCLMVTPKWASPQQWTLLLQSYQQVTFGEDLLIMIERVRSTSGLVPGDEQ
jgi:hypothetical protein